MRPHVGRLTKSHAPKSAEDLRVALRELWLKECVPLLLRLQHDGDTRIAAEARALLRRARAMGAPCELESTND